MPRYAALPGLGRHMRRGNERHQSSVGEAKALPRSVLPGRDTMMFGASNAAYIWAACKPPSRICTCMPLLQLPQRPSTTVEPYNPSTTHPQHTSHRCTPCLLWICSHVLIVFKCYISSLSGVSLDTHNIVQQLVEEKQCCAFLKASIETGGSWSGVPSQYRCTSPGERSSTKTG
jgi:hypothetical protein